MFETLKLEFSHHNKNEYVYMTENVSPLVNKFFTSFIKLQLFYHQQTFQGDDDDDKGKSFEQYLLHAMQCKSF